MLVSLPSLSNVAGYNMTRAIRKKSGTGVKTNWHFVWSCSEIDKMITRTDPMIGVLEKGGAINTIDGNRYKDGYSKDKKNGIFIHRTNNNGTANGRVSLGCLLIKAQQMTNFEKHVGRNSFKVILRRK